MAFVFLRVFYRIWLVTVYVSNFEKPQSMAVITRVCIGYISNLFYSQSLCLEQITYISCVNPNNYCYTLRFLRIT